MEATAAVREHDSSNARPPAADTGPQNGRALQLHLLSQASEVDRVLPLIAAAHAEGPFGGYPFSVEKARQRALAALGDRQAGFYVTYRERVVGMAGVVVGPYYLSDEGVLATCLTLNVAADMRRSLLGARVAALLVRAMRGWARARGANLLTIHGTSGSMKRMARGARPIGVNVIVPLGGP